MQHLTTAHAAKAAIAAAFLSFGAAALAAPDAVLQIGADMPPRAAASLAIGALGAHAMAAGLFATFVRFKSWTFPGFALSLAPILAADWWLYAKAGAPSALMALHAGGMAACVALCAIGFFAAQRAERLTQPT